MQASPAKAAVDSMVSPVPTESTADADKRSGQNNDTEQAKESVDSAQTEENAVKTETPAFETANGDIVLPELEIPIVPSGSNGVAPDPEPEQNNTNIWIDDNGDIWLPEVP